MKAIELKTEFLKNPAGIDDVTPRFFWKCEGGIAQTAYRIVCWRGPQVVWDTGKVKSSAMAFLAYAGMELHSRDRIDWSVQLWDEQDAAGETSQAWFELGLLERTDWQARWIAGDYRPSKRKRYPVDCFQREVVVRQRPVRARLYATACGLYEVRVNGKKAGEFCLAPGYTDYRRRVQYQTMDVTELLHTGVNRLTVMLADGWYRGSIGAHGLRCQYGKETKLLCQLEMMYQDGSRDVIGTDDSWQWSNDGAIRFADNKDGEVVDGNRVPTYTGHARITGHPVVPTASNNVPLTENECFIPVASASPSGKILQDFKQNIAGYISFSIYAKKGQLLHIRFGELIGKDGELCQTNIQTKSKGKRSPLQEILYVCHEGWNTYKTSFAIFGFQYAEVTSGAQISFTGDEPAAAAYAQFVAAYGQQPPVSVHAEDFRAHAVYSRMEETGFFDSSNPLLNQFVEAAKWSTKGNSADIPTDCPTRERHGWTGDAQIFFLTAGYLFDYAAFARKYLRDVYDWQRKSGRLPQIAPYAGVDPYMWPMNGSVGWSDIGILYPYRFWKLYGDRSLLEKYYNGMKAYARFMQRRCGKLCPAYSCFPKVHGKERRYLVNVGQSYDEWAEPQDVKAFVWTDFAAPHPEVSTAYTAYMMDLMIEIAKELGREEDIPNYQAYAQGCRSAYQALITRDPRFSLDTDRQARLVRPLALHLLTDEQEAYARKRLVKALDNYRWRLGTGFLSTPLILDVLAETDPENAYRLLENEEIPGWLSMPRLGATTIWESWEGATAKGEVASLNHYSKGALCEWLFARMCGIRPDGMNRFIIAPMPGGTFTHAKAEYRSLYGTVISGWKRQDGKTTFTVTVPPNCTARIILPGKEEMDVAAGEYVF